MPIDITLNDALSMFLLECEARQFTSHTMRFYHGRLSLFVRWCDQQEPPPRLHEVTPVHIRMFLVDAQRRGLSSAYVHGHARAIRAFFNYCVRDELLDVSPFARVRMPRLEKKILPALTGSEVRATLAACETERDRAVVLVLLDAGLRASELCGLNVDDVDMTTGAVHVRHGKGQKERITFIGPRTRKQIFRYLKLERTDGGKALFLSARGERLTYSGVAQIFKRLRRKVKIDNLSAHACRRTFAINALRGGMNIYVLAKLMGHADIHVLKQYLAIVEDDLRAAHASAGALDRMLTEKRNRGPPSG